VADPFLAGLWQLLKILLGVTSAVFLSLSMIAATVVALWGDEETDAETLSRLHQRTRSDFIRRGRYVAPEEISQHVQEADRPTYDHPSLHN